MAELSELTGISMATFTDFEKGKREPYKRTLRDIKVVLKSEGASFLELSEEGEGCGFMKSSPQLRFVDLFSGLGGFHAALERLGHTCVFASEIDDELREIYALNFGFNPSSNIRDTWKDIPEHEILCAGFPCQPFSKAGPQRGFDCPESGDLFDYILKTIDRHLPSFLIFENVPNILRHAEGKTWERIQSNLSKRGYLVDFAVLSPHMFGIPQVRERAIIVGSRHGLESFDWPVRVADKANLHISSVLDINAGEEHSLPPNYQRYLEVWEEFLDRIPKTAKMPSFPIWSMEFGADYPIETLTPFQYNHRYLARFKGCFGKSLKGLSKGQQLAFIPAYARDKSESFPHWKIRFIQQNRGFYQLHMDRLKDWLPKVQEFAPSFQKFEWNHQDGERTVWDKIIQFRASGIRVKSPSAAPSLVALTTSQVPVISWERRYMTMVECARLQCLDSLNELPSSKVRAFKALGNAVNVDVIAAVAEKLIGQGLESRDLNEAMRLSA